ncbi:GNAT family N-acetyltransferase [Maribacter sp. TH_r10]|uniref:GNAT family N-acetyltransferase n=1 Tax=Maribacter sp. TH_r10 TaxID=3082086 RepID=UPI00295392B1|nr:GNAT family N-acetyltransferase [Maribacter sp. TH_r10]MDV7140127.1 GNAT family N-acetyltransferase [Maribacter sp. TH_r10]
MQGLEAITVRKYKKGDKEIWDDFIDHSKNSTFLFKRDFMDYHKDRFNDCSLIVFENDVTVAAFPAHRVDEYTIASHFGLSYGGIILRKTETLYKTLQIVYKILYVLKENHINKIIYKSFHKFYNSIGAEEITYAKFLVKAKLTVRQFSSVINLNDKLEMNRTRLRLVRRAKKLGVVIKEVDTFHEYWNQILMPNLKDKYNAKPAHTVEEIIRLHKSFPSNIRQFNAYLNNTIVAGATIFETTNVVRVQYNSANDEGRQSGASDLLYFELIENNFKHKNYFDFGSSFDCNGLNLGLLKWKESFGARAFSIDTFEIETKNYHLLEKDLIFNNQKVVLNYHH